MICPQKNRGRFLRACRAIALVAWLVPLALTAYSDVPTTQDLADSARQGDGLIQALEQEYAVKRQAILDDPKISVSEKQQKISAMDGELKKNRVQVWEKHIHPFQERIINEVNEGLSEAEKVRPTGGSELYAKDDDGNYITQRHADGRESKVYNRQFKGADLDVGTGSAKAADKLTSIMKQYGFDPENSNRYSADFMNGKFTMNVGPDKHPSGSYKHRSSVMEMGNNYETFVSISCKKVGDKCPGEKLVTVNDVNSKGMKYLHDAPVKLLGFENQDKLSNAAKSALKAIEVGEVTDKQLEKLTKDKGFTPDEFKRMLTDIKADGKSFAGVGLNEKNIADFQEIARGATDQAVENAKVEWELDKRNLQQERRMLEETFNSAKENGNPEAELEKLRSQMRGIDSALIDGQVRVDTTTQINERLKVDANTPPSATDRALRKVNDTLKNASGAAGSFVKDAGFEQATRTQGASLADAAKDVFKPGWLGAIGTGADAYKLYKCSEDPSSSARHVCYWREGSGAVFNVMSDIGVAGSAGIGLGGALGTGTAAGLVSIGAPIVVTGAAGAQVSELVGEVKGAQAAKLNEKFINYRAEERTLEVILRRETLARELLEKFKSTGDWEYLKQSQAHIARLRRAGKVSADARYTQSADLVQARAAEYAAIIAANPTKQDEFDFESNQLSAGNETDITNLQKQVANHKAAQGRNLSVDTAASSLSFNAAASAIADHKVALAQIEKNRRETAEIYAQIEESRKRREREWADFWEGLNTVASAATIATTEYIEQKREIDELVKTSTETRLIERVNEINPQQDLVAFDPCAAWKRSPADYQRCKNDPCNVYVYDQYAWQSCQANLYASSRPSGDVVPIVKSDNMREGVCNTLYDDGADEPEQYSIPVSASGRGAYVYWYQHYNKKDRARIYFNGRMIWDTGCTGDSESKELPELSGGGQVKIIIDPKCDPADSSGTKWEFKLSCP